MAMYMIEMENGMQYCSAPKNQTTRRILLMACLIALVAAFTVAAAALRRRYHTATPAPGLAPVPAGLKLFLGTHGVGTQNHCRPRALRRLRTLHAADAIRRDVGNSSPYFSPTPTCLTQTLIPRWWPMVRFASRGSTGTRAPSGPSCTNLVQTAMERSPSTRRRLPGSRSMWLTPRMDRPVATS